MAFFSQTSSGPAKVKLQKGETYFYCTCGATTNEPFCNGAHAGTPHRSISITAERSKKVLLCTCKRSTKMPFCDGCKH